MCNESFVVLRTSVGINKLARCSDSSCYPQCSAREESLNVDV